MYLIPDLVSNTFAAYNFSNQPNFNLFASDWLKTSDSSNTRGDQRSMTMLES